MIGLIPARFSDTVFEVFDVILDHHSSEILNALPPVIHTEGAILHEGTLENSMVLRQQFHDGMGVIDIGHFAT
ncbi:MAG: hypothetical protein ABI604_06810 [Nitrospirota bacterium]